MASASYGQDKATALGMGGVPIFEYEFTAFRRLIYDLAGIDLGPAKQMMVAGRLRNRLSYYNFASYMAYYHFVTSAEGSHEQQVMIDALTTNETFFFRESAHFDYLRREVLPSLAFREPRLWSAACSTGEETYSLAMTLSASLPGGNWELIGSDVNQQVLERARAGHYSLQRHEGIPQRYLKQYCLRGTGSQEGSFLIHKNLRQRVEFRQINLTHPLPDLGLFDVIFLRNVLIYFDKPTKLDIVRRVCNTLRHGGYFFTSHTENIHGIDVELDMLRPSIYRKR